MIGRKTYEVPPLCDQPCVAHCPYAQELYQTQKLESLGLMVSEIVHDLNNLHSVILGHSELAREKTAKTSPLHEHIEDIRMATNNASSLCRNLLAYVGKATPVPTAVDIAKLINELQQLIRVIVPRQTTLNCWIAPDLPCVHSDPNHVRQILMNLIINAAEALDGQPGTIRLTVEPRPCADVDGDSGRDGVCIIIADTGCGIDAATRDLLFEPFYSTKANGRGLGLPAVKGLTEAIGGTITVESLPGKGTIFTVWLPSCARDARAARDDGDEPITEEWQGHGTVLLAEDESKMRKWFTDALHQMGLNVLVAKDGIEAVEYYERRHHEIDVLLLDISMPRMDGCEALARIREIDPNARVIIISGYTESDLSHRWNGAPPDAVLLKPFTTQEFKRLAQRVFAKPGAVH